MLLSETYDDGGLSGGSLERPALQKMLEHIGDGRMDQIVVYRIDRLTRSPADFARIVDIPDAAKASFVSVTRSFNTATVMGRPTLNMPLGFARFEREVTAERIRDRMAASKRKGLWMGGAVPIGYDPDGRALRINGAEAGTVRTLYDPYEQHGSIRAVREAAERLGPRTRRRGSATGNVSGGGFCDRGHIHCILTNPVFAGRVRHRKVVHDGLHEAIIDPERRNRIQVQLRDGAFRSRSKAGTNQKSLLRGKLFDETGDRRTPSHMKTRKGIRLRCCISHRPVTRGRDAHPDAWRLPAREPETKGTAAVRCMLTDNAFAAWIVPDGRVEEIARIRSRLVEQTDVKETESLLRPVEKMEIAPADMRVSLNGTMLAEMPGIGAKAIDDGLPSRNFPFQPRKRGVETRLILI